MKEYKYDVVFSFASEQREYIEKVANELKKMGVRLFYDNHEAVDLWGKDLIKYLDDIILNQSRYFVMFISKDYLNKKWTIYESEVAEERNFINAEKEAYQQYILPIRFDDTKIPGIKSHWGYLTTNGYSPEELAKKIYEKIHNKNNFFTEGYVDNIDELYSLIIEQVKSHFYTNETNSLYSYNISENYIIFNFSRYSIKIEKNILLQTTESLLIYDSYSTNEITSNFYKAKIMLDDEKFIHFFNMGFYEKSDIISKTSINNFIEILIKKIENIS